MIACRTRQDLSSASSTMAGSRLSDSSSMPITASLDLALLYEDSRLDQPVFTISSLLIIFSRTSGKSSLRRCKKRGSRCSIVASLPSKGAKPLI